MPFCSIKVNTYAIIEIERLFSECTNIIFADFIQKRYYKFSIQDFLERKDQKKEILFMYF